MPLSDPKKLQALLTKLGPEDAEMVRSYVTKVENRDLVVLRIVERIVVSLINLEKNLDAVRFSVDDSAKLHGRVEQCLDKVPDLITSTMAHHKAAERAQLAPILTADKQLRELETARRQLENARLQAELDRGSNWQKLVSQALDNKYVLGGIGALIQSLLALLYYLLGGIDVFPRSQP